MPLPAHRPPQNLVELIDEAVCEAVHTWQDRTSEENFIYCHVCGDVDGHKGLCPIPAMQKFIDSTDEEVAAS